MVFKKKILKNKIKINNKYYNKIAYKLLKEDFNYNKIIDKI
jgi:hypothetical protein